MKTKIIIALVALATLALSACSGCGCPGGAGYGNNQTVESPNSDLA